ncbi:MAG: hypothetical protein HS115_12530 [Spirochaetales bacterium]|nr:hypothetical protein [Spirochaetales bacterium]
MNQETNSSIAAVLHLREIRAEILACFVRLFLLLLLVGAAYATLIYGQARAADVYFQLSVIATAFAYSSLVLYLILRQKYRSWFKYSSVLLDAVLLSAVLFGTARNDAPATVLASAMVFLYPLQMGLAALRSDPRLVLLATLASVLGFAANWIYFLPEIRGLPGVPAATPESFILKTLYLSLTGLVLAFLAREVRRVALYAVSAAVEHDRVVRDHEALLAYLPEDLALLVKEGQLDLREGQEREVTILSLSLILTDSEPQSLVQTLNSRLEQISSFLLEAGGVLERSHGATITILFGLSDPIDHARQALQVARSLVTDWNGLVHIGIHSASLVFGATGSPGRQDFQALGEDLEVARCLAEFCGLLDRSVLISETVLAGIRDRPALDALGSFQVRGARDDLFIYSFSHKES